jgi:ADP-heptose:LPS heptosyltransferase
MIPKSAERIAVCVSDFPSLGDQFALLPLFEGLRRRFPGCRILAASRYEIVRIAEEHGFVDETLIYRQIGRESARSVRRFDPQISICLRRRSMRANAQFGRWSGASCTIGYRRWGNGVWHTHLIPYRADVYRPRRHLAALETLGGEGDLPGTVRQLAASSPRLADPRPSAVLVSCGAKGRKHWGAARYAEVAHRLSVDHPDLAWYSVIGPREVEQGCGEIFRKAPTPIEVVAGRSLPDLAHLLRSARLVIANDCGPAHLAQMAGVPIVQPFDNSDDLNGVAIRSWFDLRPGAICLTPRARAPIDTVPLDAVVHAAREVLEDPTIEGSIRYFD